MRPVSAALGTFLDSESIAGPIRHLVTVKDRAGSVLARWTDHESDLTVSGTTYYAGASSVSATAPIVEVGDLDQVAGTEVGTLSLRLLCGETATLSGVRLPLAAMNGTFNGSTVQVLRLFQKQDGATWHDPMWWWEGPVGEVRPSSAVVELDVESGIAALNVMLPRLVYGPGCSNMLFDDQCLADPDVFKFSGTVAASPDPTDSTFTSTDGLMTVTDWFTLGVLTFKSDTSTVALRGVSRGVRVDTYTVDEHALTLDRALPVAPASGDTFDVWPGCDKTRKTCKDKFDNLVHFRGFPDVPRNEAAL